MCMVHSWGLHGPPCAFHCVLPPPLFRGISLVDEEGIVGYQASPVPLGEVVSIPLQFFLNSLLCQ